VQNVAVRGAFFARLFVPQEEPKPVHQRVEEALDCDVRELGRRGLRLGHAYLLQKLRGARLFDLGDFCGLSDAQLAFPDKIGHTVCIRLASVFNR
jgi:hypothetical protein